MSDESKKEDRLLERIWEIQAALQLAATGDFSKRVSTEIYGAYEEDPLAAIAPSINMLLDELALRERKLGAQQVKLHEQVDYLNKLPIFMSVLELDGTLKFANQAPLRPFGWTLDDVKGKPFAELDWWSVDAELQATVKQLVADGGQGKSTEVELDPLVGSDRIPVRFTCDPLHDEDGKIYALIMTGTPIIEQRRAMAEVQEKLAIIEAQQEAIADLSTPVIRIFENVLALPIVGMLDSQRAQQAMEVVLERVIEEKARIVLIDITGVPVVDSLVANSLAQTIAAIQLIGAQGVLTGISANVAQTLVKLGVDTEMMTTRGNLADGLLYALSRIGYEVAKKVAK